jgi:hypothetical protein
MENYKGYFVSGSAVPKWYLTGRKSKSLGIVFKSGRLGGSVVEFKRIEGATFKGKQEAEQHGLELCKSWVDEYEAMEKQMDALERRFAETHDPEAKKQLEDLSRQRVRMLP